MDFIILESKKHGINTKESYMVVRGKTIYLRIIGKYPEYIVMTATTSEDNNRYVKCEEKNNLISTAWILGNELEAKPENLNDWCGREYIKICNLQIKPKYTQEEIRSGLNEIIIRFFQVYDLHLSSKNNEMEEIYHSLSINDSGEDIYLSDGIWLSSNGELHEKL